MFKFKSPSLRQNRGFTLVEMVVTVAVMAILIGMSTPAIFEFMRQRDRQNEEIAQQQVVKAMQAYLADTGTLPTDTGTGANSWSTLLAAYTDLSADQIANDVWGRPRSYIVYLNNSRKLFGTTVNVYYATLHSMGTNGVAENTYKDSTGTGTITGLALTQSGSRTIFAGSTSTDWWKAQGATPDAKVTAFSTMRAGGDDTMTRFTNYSEMLDRYNATVQRLDRLTQALETYARSHYAERVSFCNTAGRTAALCDNGVPEQTIYYPKAIPVSGGADAANVQYANGTTFVNNTKADVDRRTDMQALMNELGLPAEFCCTAMENASDGNPMPLYYFSNPRPRTSTSCGARPTLVDGKLPARITTKNSGDSNSDRTCG